MCLLTNHVYSYLTMSKQIADVGLNYWCCVAVMLGAILLWALAHLEYYLRGAFNKITDFFVQAFKIVVDS